MQGYYRYPTIHDDRVVFTCEDDLWEVELSGGLARRLTTGRGAVTTSALSPDGALLAMTSSDEGGAEVHVMPARGGQARRLTFEGHDARVIGWSLDGERVRYTSSAHQPFGQQPVVFEVAAAGGEPAILPVGPAVWASDHPGGGRVIGRHQDDCAAWKRYRGGLAGALWIDRDGDGCFTRLAADLDGNLVRPLWIGARVYFISDHEGVGNLYSTRPDGSELRRHTTHEAFFARHPSTDGRRVVYHAGADLWLFDPAEDRAWRLEVTFASPQARRARRFVPAAPYLEDADLHPAGHSVALTVRGRPFVMGLFEGAVMQPGAPHGVRYRLARYLGDGERLVVVSDRSGEEALELHRIDGSAAPVRLAGLDTGRIIDLITSPTEDRVAFVNHRHELVTVDLTARSLRVLDRSAFEQLSGLAFSPDGRAVAYGCAETARTSSIKLAFLDTGAVHRLTRPEFRDVDPCFDPRGRYLYFLSYRDFDPVYDAQAFDLGFPEGMRLCLITLRADLRSPFVPEPRPLERDDDDEAADEGREEEADEAPARETRGRRRAKRTSDRRRPAPPPRKDAPAPLTIDLDGISRRVLLFPVEPGQFSDLIATDERVLYISHPIRGSLGGDSFEEAGELDAFDLEQLEENVVMDDVSSACLGADGKTLLVQASGGLRVLSASQLGERADDGDDARPGRRSGWLDLSRLSVEVIPPLEWAQMLREAWRLMRDHFWSEDMAGVDWEAVYRLYAPLIERVGCRAEFSDLVWEMQGELGTSHAYESGGDYRRPPAYDPGFLGASLAYDPQRGGFAITDICQGDLWDVDATSPLTAPGLDVRVGDVIVAVGGQPVRHDRPVQALLVNQARREVALTLAPRPGEAPDAPRRVVTVRTLGSERAARYRDWVERNRAQVHEATGARCGYIHIPDMGPEGFSEFHRAFLVEVARPALIIDVRFNAGGHVSALLLEKLARRRLGYDVPRWGAPTPYPHESVQGPMVALINEYAGSDGDVFSHCFRMMKLGALIGTRTWGGVIGTWPRHDLVDGSVTSQPEFGCWFVDVGWSIENHGVMPDIEVDIRPQDHAAGRDPQLERALREVIEALNARPPHPPRFHPRPDRSLPWSGRAQGQPRPPHRRQRKPRSKPSS